MLRKCTEQEFEKYIDFAYTLALESSKSGYPTYNDGIKTKEMFIERAKQAEVAAWGAKKLEKYVAKKQKLEAEKKND